MRLSSIKLAGFKSFVDPTNFQLPGQLVGVVGPNGCGKSNIIDAVRWVLGESRASELRGESMQDVIFNGSTQRKPSGRASVELVFDNADGRAAGQWSQYAEIAVKRVLTRDGTSSYFINNQAVRRKDIHDIFLGTGLGPRAYAIIGQGMISRIIEAKPEELRIFLEEAAGVSKYKERRRETENRLSDTRENLTRVGDILRELETNLAKLEGQAEVAERYAGLNQDATLKQNLLWLLRKREAETEQDKQRVAVAQAQTALEAEVAKLRELEAGLETLRTDNYAATDKVNEAQGALYEANAEVSRLEAEIRFIVESRNRAQAQLTGMQAQREQWLSQASGARAELEATRARLEDASVQAIAVSEQVAGHAEQLPEIESRWREAQEALAAERDAIVQAEQTLKLEAQQQRNADQLIQQLEARQDRLKAEHVGLARPDAEKLSALEEDLAVREAGLEDARAALETAEAAVPEREAERRAAQQAVQQQAAALSSLEARSQALKQLQERVQSEGKIQPWLAKHELAGLPRLWKQLQVESGWETALEAVLRERVAALEVSNLDWVKAFAADAPPAKLAFYARPQSAPQAAPSNFNEGKPLLGLVNAADAGVKALLADWLAGVHAVDSLPAALAMRARIPAGDWVVTPEGHLVSPTTVQLYATDSQQDGMLARQHEIETLAAQIQEQQIVCEDARAAVQRAESAYADAVAALSGKRAQVEQATQQIHGLRIEALTLAKALEQYTQRSGQIDEELAELNAQLEAQREIRDRAEAVFSELDAKLGDLQGAYQESRDAFDGLEASLADARETLRNLERSAQEADFAQRNLQQRIDELERSEQTAIEQAERLAAALLETEDELKTIDEQSAQAGLQQVLAVRAKREQALTEARTAMDALSFQLRQADETRLGIERSLEPLRTRITELQLKEQAARLAQEQFSEQLAEAQADEQALEPFLTPDLKASNLQGELTRIQNAIQSLGPVNMAALDELKAAKERKEFLDAQSADLTDAINTLEDAIRKIDGETRELLQGTFDKVNHHFGELFPTLFGGGMAKLIMTGEEILDAGVQVMAQPPGKKNSTIHLLSGGEKALTAIALVFAMFQLNPAPFCLLDEVDAPLDDANTERYANMVKRMSDKTQFVFISHNKIAMEMAEQLIGVTMQEQGVSRIVAVDVTEALSLADAA
ncbi:MAG: chromosome segregation protein SMC [Candidatus Protistobacter heckmanni]|nr:chromosome segregation protein SMC [Candidatus Protistobacter heckmanni]